MKFLFFRTILMFTKWCWLVQIKHFFRVHFKQYSHSQRVTTKQEKTNFQNSYQTLLALWWSYSQTRLHTFPDIRQYWHFQRVLANNTTHFSRVYIKQYWCFQRVSSKLNYSKTFFQSLYHTILTLSQSYSQTILIYLELISNSIHIFTELIPNSSKHFF